MKKLISLIKNNNTLLPIEKYNQLCDLLTIFIENYVFNSFLILNAKINGAAPNQYDFFNEKGGHCYDSAIAFQSICSEHNLKLKLFGTSSPPHIYSMIKINNQSIYILDVMSETKPILIQTYQRTNFRNEQWQLTENGNLLRFSSSNLLIDTIEMDKQNNLYQDIILDRKLVGGVYALSRREKNGNLQYIKLDLKERDLSFQLDGLKCIVNFDDINLETHVVNRFVISKEAFKPCYKIIEEPSNLENNSFQLGQIITNLSKLLNQSSPQELILLIIKIIKHEHLIMNKIY